MQNIQRDRTQISVINGMAHIHHSMTLFKEEGEVEDEAENRRRIK